MGTAITERAAADALGADRGGRAGARRRPRRAGGDAAGAAQGRGQADAAAGRGDARGRGPGRHAAEEGRAERFRELVDGAVDLPSSRSDWPRAAPTSRRRRGATGRWTRSRRCWRRWGRRSSRDELVRRGRGPPRRRSGAGDRAGARRRRHAGARPGCGAEPRRARCRRAEPTLTPRERRERALLAMCDRRPEGGARGPRAADAGAPVLAAGRRALEWLRAHLDEPLDGLPRDDEELVALVTAAGDDRASASRPRARRWS